MKIESINTHHYLQSFKHQHKKRCLKIQNPKEAYLEKVGIYPPYSTIIANFDTKRYLKAIHLLKNGVDFTCLEEITSLDKKRYKQAITLVKEGLFDNFIYEIAQLDSIGFSRALDYRKQGLNNNCLKLFSELNSEETETAIRLIQEHELAPIIAGNLSKLGTEQRKVAIDFLDLTEIGIACKIANLEQDKQQKCRRYLEQGVNQNNVIEIAELDKEQEKRLPEIFSLDVGDKNITDFAQMTDEEYKRAKELVELGVNPNAIFDIILIEEGKGENEDYSEYRSRGYSYSTSASLSALNEEQLDALEKIIEKNPEIKELFKEEYSISVIQLQTDEQQEAIFTKSFRTKDKKTKITLVQTFDTYGDKTKSRIETNEDKTTTSFLRNKSGVFKAKYDKYGEIEELTELIQDFKTNETTGIIHSKKSPILPGLFESTYYSIDEIKEGGNTTPDCDIENCITSTGTPISSITKNNDGSITFYEDYQIKEFGITRKYTEKRNKSGVLTYSNYEYKITNEDTKTTLMDISRTFKKNKNNTSTNIINGIEYTLSYDDDKKAINITAGNKSITLEFAEKLPKYSKDILWNVIKELQVDSLISINKNIKKWHYGEDEDSLTDNNNKILSTGKNRSIIEHEVGHIQIDSNESIIRNPELIQTYGEEMDNFKFNLPYNEQEFIQYFSQRAELQESDGLEEFIAETNVLLTTYGINYKKLNTRTQFLAKYFPATIAKIAELLGKTSTKNLLE